MKKPTILIAGAFLALIVPGKIYAGDDMSSKILPYPILQKKLSNGLNVVTVPYDSPGLAAFYIVVRTGSRNEVEEGKSGFAHFFEHMMFRGTDKYPNEKYSEVLKSTGASANANTSLDRTVYHMTGNAAKLETMFELESDRFMNLKYSLQDFKTEAGAVKGEYTKNSANPYVQLNEQIQNTAFDRHTYKHTTMGFFKDIVDMPNQYEYSIEFFHRFYRPEYCTLIVVGDVDPTNVNNLAEKYFGKWERGNYQSMIPVEPEQKEARYTHLKKAGFPPYMDINFKGPAFSDHEIDMPALDVLCSILFSEKSNLYKKLVLDEQKARFINGGAQDSRDPFLISIGASVKKASDMQYVKDQIMAAIDSAKTNKVSDAQLKETKMHLKYSFAMSIDNPTSIAESLSAYTWLTGDPESLNRLYALYDRVTADDLIMVANKYFQIPHMTVGTIADTNECPVK
ncbi:MAG: insulinase family protein [Bacteroidia bacterium]|nr:insulinase family protein [Bacteroidia bacterium]